MDQHVTNVFLRAVDRLSAAAKSGYRKSIGCLFYGCLHFLERKMLERALWRLADKLREHDRKQTIAAFTWIKATYGADLDIHTRNASLHGAKIIAFNPKDRDSVKFSSSPMENLFHNYKYMHRRKAINFCVSMNETKAFEAMSESGAELPWIGATLWKRPDRKDIAWALGVRNATVVGKQDQLGDIVFYAAVCEEITEMVLKSLVPPPLELSL